jgi:hypothetical protein
MTTYKRIPDLYHIQSPSVIIDGNLIVTGNSQSITSTDTQIANNKITLNAGVSTPNPLGAIIEVDRGGLPTYGNVAIRWTESYGGMWQASNPSGTFSNIAFSLTGGTGLTSVSADPSPALGGNLNLAGQVIYDTGNPTANIRLYTGTVGTGGTGLYVTNSTLPAPTELVNTSKATLYGIIFS